MNDKVQTEKEKIEKVIEYVKVRLQCLLESISSFKRYLPPMSSAVERWKFLKNKTATGQMDNSIVERRRYYDFGQGWKQVNFYVNIFLNYY